jgi:hypothetical protein
MKAAVDVGEGAMQEGDTLVVTGERNLLNAHDLASNMERLRQLFDLFEQKTSLLHLLDESQKAQGVQIYIGGESGLVPLDECSVVTAPYEVNGQVIGTLGVIGPTRMAYERVIPIVDVTAKLLSSALGTSGSKIEAQERAADRLVLRGVRAPRRRRDGCLLRARRNVRRSGIRPARTGNRRDVDDVVRARHGSAHRSARYRR